MSHALTRLALLLAVLLPVWGTSCTVDDSFPDQPGIFTCGDDSDCEFPYECRANRCERPATQNTDCIDEDNDGYVIGEDNTECRFPILEKDPDDTNPAIFPNAPEVCDGIDNDADPSTEDGVIACTPTNKFEVCPQIDVQNTQSECRDGVCVYVSIFGAREECQDYVATCTNGEILPLPPAGCD